LSVQLFQLAFGFRFLDYFYPGHNTFSGQWSVVSGQ
jgi:hypothetical protein